MKFSPNQVQIVPKGEQFSALYQKDGVSLVMELCFSKQGRARITVKNKNEVVENVEIRLPTTNLYKANSSCSPYLQYTRKTY